jgi:biotin-(acetyl-CoA carboxylase) ligase
MHVSNLITFIITILGAIVGGGIAGHYSLKATKQAHQHQKEISEENEKLIISGLLQAIHDELETVFERYQDSMGTRIESLAPEQPLLFYYPLMSDFFSIYNGNTFLIGRIRNNDLRKSIIKTYTLAKGTVDSYRMNNELLQRYEHWESIFAETKLPAHEEKAKAHYLTLIEYAKKLKTQHLELKENVKATIRTLIKHGVLDESLTK